MENIKVLNHKVHKKGGRRCNADDWATVHWKTFDAQGQKLEDSRQYKKKQPIVFKIGRFETARCWDIALVNTHAQESIKINCPAFYGYGGVTHYS